MQSEVRDLSRSGLISTLLSSLIPELFDPFPYSPQPVTCLRSHLGTAAQALSVSPSTVIRSGRFGLSPSKAGDFLLLPLNRSITAEV